MRVKKRRLSSERISRRFFLQVVAYQEATGIKFQDLFLKLGISGNVWFRWKTGAIKRIKLETIKYGCEVLDLNFNYITGGSPPQKSTEHFTQFVELNEIYSELLRQGDVYGTSQLIRKSALLCYDIMTSSKLPMHMTITNRVAKDATHIADDLILLDCAVHRKIYRLQVVPGMTIAYCFGVLDGANGQKILHEGTVSMSILLTTIKYLKSKLEKAANAPDPDDGSYFIDQAREFSRNLT